MLGRSDGVFRCFGGFLFLLVFLSGGNSADKELWKTAVIIKLPFLILPIALFMLPRIGKKLVIQLHYWLLIVVAVTGIPVLLNAIFHYKDMIQLLSQGQHIPTPIEAVKYSMFNAKSETASTRAAFKEPYQKRRCVVTVSGFYEWTKSPQGNT